MSNPLFEDLPVTFTVPGTPRGQGRPRATTIGEHARMYKAKADRNYEMHIRDAFMRHMERLAPGDDWKPYDGPVKLYVLALFAIPKSMPKWEQRQIAAGDSFRAKRPDADNILKAVLDALNGYAVCDDRQMVALEIEKAYADKGEPRLRVDINPLPVRRRGAE